MSISEIPFFPNLCRVRHIQELIQTCVRQKDVELLIEPAPPGSSQEDSATLLVKRSACVDANAFSPLRRLMSKKQARSPKGPGLVMTTEVEEFGLQEQVQVWNSFSFSLCLH